MDATARATVRRPDWATETALGEPARMLTVAAIYRLSEAGRKASLLAGGDGRAVQQLTVPVPAGRLHLVSVDDKGTARLKLRPRFEVGADDRLVRHDSPPIYDMPPSIDDLFRDAARTHELERRYLAERSAARTQRRDAERDRRVQIAEAFLADKTRRAIGHPAPSPRRCVLQTDHGRVVFDTITDEGVARNVPPEASRRFRADLAAKRQQNLKDRAAQLVLHEEKKRFVAEWMTQHGTPDQRERLAAGMLPMDEAIEAITDQVLAPLADRPRYRRDGVERLAEHIRAAVGEVAVEVSPRTLEVVSSTGTTADAAQWAQMQDFRAHVPDAAVALRWHRLGVRGRADIPPLLVPGILVTVSRGPFVLRREYEGATGRA